MKVEEKWAYRSNVMVGANGDIAAGGRGDNGVRTVVQGCVVVQARADD